jgi:serine/threonine-protein kinase RsbW
MAAEIDIRLPNQLSEMEGLFEALEAFADETDMPARARFNLNLAVDEFVSNAITYGYPDGRVGEVGVHLTRRDDRLDVTLSDDGDAFDPLTAPPPDLDASLEERRIGGLGVHLIRTMADEFAYRRQDGRNVVALTLKFDKA